MPYSLWAFSALAGRGDKIMKRVLALSIGLLLVGIEGLSLFARTSVSEAVTTSKNALAAEQEIACAMQDNNGPDIASLLSDDWAVIATSGRIAEGPSIFPDGIKSGFLARKAFEISEPRVRIYGNVAVITTKGKTSQTSNRKLFDVTERHTDVLFWKDGWKSILTQETKIEDPSK